MYSAFQPTDPAAIGKDEPAHIQKLKTDIGRHRELCDGLDITMHGKNVLKAGLHACLLAIPLDENAATVGFRDIKSIMANVEALDEFEFQQSVTSVLKKLAQIPRSHTTKLPLLALQLDIGTQRARLRSVPPVLGKSGVFSQLLTLVDIVWRYDVSVAQEILDDVRPAMREYASNEFSNTQFASLVRTACLNRLPPELLKDQSIFAAYINVVISSYLIEEKYDEIEEILKGSPEIYALIKDRYSYALQSYLRKMVNYSGVESLAPLREYENCTRLQKTPESTLAPWRATLGYELLAKRENEPRERSGQTPPQKPNGAGKNILVVANNAWFFTNELIDELEKNSDFKVRTFDFSIAQNTLGLSPVSASLPTDTGQTTPMVCNEAYEESTFKALIDWSDVVFVEWCEWAAVWMSNYLPENKRLVIRLHSYEAFAATPYFLNWSRVDGMIFVADHIRKFFDIQHQERYGKTDQIVIKNIRDLKGFASQGTVSRDRTLGMVGYNNANKEPLMALKILKPLLKDDPSWRIKFIGDGWGADEDLSETELAYKRKFYQYVQRHNLETAIEYSGYVANENINACMLEIGLILSCSEREGTHESVIEGIASGCIPLIRNWPTSAAYNGAQTHYSAFSDFIFDEVEQGVVIAKKYAAPTQKQRDEMNRLAVENFDLKAVYPQFEKFLLGK